jgi:hypothetical protein
MPPKKRARLSSHAASTPSESVPEPVEETPTPMEVDSSREELTLDPWTDEQETSLFKSMVRWKPVGPFSYRIVQRPVTGSMVSLNLNSRDAQAFSNDRNL